MNKYEIIITGRNPNYFIKKLIIKKIFIYDLEIIDRRNIKIIVDEYGLGIISKIKTSYKYKIVNRYGLVKFLYLLKKYYVSLICFVLGIVLNIYLSTLIFDVEINHQNNYIRELVSNDLKYYGVKKYKHKLSFKKREEVIKKILEKEKDNLEWLEIEEVGTKYIVSVEQRKKNKIIGECKEQNIVAKRDAMIMEIKAYEGEVVKKKLDYVKKGDVIISGAIHNKEDIVSKRCAKGIVYGEVWYKIDLEVPKKYIEENLTGREKNKLEVSFFNKNYTLFNKFSSYLRKTNKIIESNTFPISVNITKYLETKRIVKNYNIINIDKEINTLINNSLERRLSKDSSIITKKVLKKEEKKSKIIIEVFVKVKENITDTADIIEEEKKE